MTQEITAADLARHLLALAPQRRVMAAIAGAPASGKSTLAEALVDALNAAEPGSAALMPMDGYHYDDLYLIPAGLRPRKGAPETFDVGGLRHTIERLRKNDEAHVAVPVFDRDIEIARAGARLIPSSIRIIVCEGNYLLLDRPGWRDLKPLFDVTVAVEVPEAELRARLTRRWQGYDLPAEEVRRRVDENDMPNGLVVMAESAPADYRLRS
ncbi:nucleoside/nucleotide kinase family protein [Oryzibacter oryziterrae]|uniref:nucleoside/nucleotide kinase family protein n=1 Tax=Oryzibacter oryziterrae TaxID=2766474 RepID=UPI001F2E9CC0|nr:nucleoside/nucleotide kinase family protein [Oryzibacter oryziterrae]